MLKYNAHPNQLKAWCLLRDALSLIRRLRKDLAESRLGHVIANRAEEVIHESLQAVASFREHDFKKEISESPKKPRGKRVPKTNSN